MTSAMVLPDTITPGSSEWWQLVTASKVPAILGLSPWQSPFSVWHRMNGTAAPEPQTTVMERGHYLEPAVAHWFADHHPTLTVSYPCPTYARADQPRYAASPDRMLHDPHGNLVGLLECKTAADSSEKWDEVPVYYQAQCQWQAYVLNVPRVHVAVLTSYLEFRELVVERDEQEISVIVARVDEFLRTLAAGQAPPIDGHSDTYQVVRELHPLINGEDVDVDPEICVAYLNARSALGVAETDAVRTAAALLDAMGDAKRARFMGDVIASRVPGRGTNPPYLKAAPVKKTGVFPTNPTESAA